MGRLWQTLILYKWNRLFGWLPVETLVKESQNEYYSALASSDAQADSTDFIEFMLRMISTALEDVSGRHDDGGLNVGINGGLNVGIKNETAEQQEHVLSLVRENPSITVAQMAEVLGVSKRQMERIVANLKVEGRLIRTGSKRNGRWEAH